MHTINSMTGRHFLKNPSLTHNKDCVTPGSQENIFTPLELLHFRTHFPAASSRQQSISHVCTASRIIYSTALTYTPVAVTTTYILRKLIFTAVTTLASFEIIQHFGTQTGAVEYFENWSLLEVAALSFRACENFVPFYNIIVDLHNSITR